MGMIRNPVGVENHNQQCPRVAALAATLGYMPQPRWGRKLIIAFSLTAMPPGRPDFRNPDKWVWVYQVIFPIPFQSYPDNMFVKLFISLAPAGPTEANHYRSTDINPRKKPSAWSVSADLHR